jgi:hypothetical protein
MVWWSVLCGGRGEKEKKRKKKKKKETKNERTKEIEKSERKRFNIIAIEPLEMTNKNMGYFLEQVQSQ